MCFGVLVCHCRLKFKDEMNKRQEMEELMQQYVSHLSILIVQSIRKLVSGSVLHCIIDFTLLVLRHNISVSLCIYFLLVVAFGCPSAPVVLSLWW